MIAAGHQPNYLPWLGFFDKIKRCDVFIIEDSVQFEQQGFTNRNKIKTSNGIKWLTVPIVHVGKPLPISEVKINKFAEKDWAKRHWLTLKHNYHRAPFWEKYSSLLEETYGQEWDMLIDLNIFLIKSIMNFLNISKPLVMASSLGVSGKGSELVLAQCKAVGADTLLFGSGGLNYLNKQRFEEEGIKLIFQDFKYPVYAQLYGEFALNLSVIDYLLCTGGKSWTSQCKENTKEVET